MIGLLAEAYKHETEVRSDLLAMGAPLDGVFSGALSWQDLKAYLMAPPPGSYLAVLREVWSPTDNLLSVVIYLQRVLSWQTAGNKRAKQPEFQTVSSIMGMDKRRARESKPYGRGVSIEEMNRRLGLS